MTPERIAGLLAGIRQAQHGRPMLNPHLAEMLLWVAAGVDHRGDLGKVMGLKPMAVARSLHQLMGRGARKRGTISHAPLRLIEERKHPDRQGKQLLLTPEAHQLIASTFAPPST